ncbi:uncharacterized protein B0I36DRAFT_321327 [Microdochium trichocladiopsis]|uniref:Uncharacterized protein n=1 Tax=Microdochium trichocladiopsis TaxID=1682393 RepID=A0A9P9BS13_9PEZI|nr:uncharacterized protein B0I36DRAFT_321327 [Microdochium trichocladiopsis]KAH7033385.1 hypothetical protein B0I36DRAFT_321327 [Microdochium trichocladiopsis]
MQHQQEASAQEGAGQPEAQSQAEQAAPKPFPMLPGQVTPLPSQVGSAPVPLPLPPSSSEQSAPNPATSQSSQTLTSPQRDSFPPNQPRYGTGALQQGFMGQPGGASSQAGMQHVATMMPMGQQPVHAQGQAMQGGLMPQHQVLPQQQFQQPTASTGSAAPANSSITDAGKSMKKWARKMFSSGSEKTPGPVTGTSVIPPRTGAPTNMPMQTASTPPRPQQYFQPQPQPQGSTQHLGQLQPAQMYNLPMRPQPPLMAVPENQALGTGSSQPPSQPTLLGMKHSASMPQIPQAQKPTQPSQSQQNNVPMSVYQQSGMQRPMQNPGQPLMVPGQFRQQVYQQQPGPGTPQVPKNGHPGPAPMQAAPHGASSSIPLQEQPVGNHVPANISARQSSGTFSGHPAGQHPQHRNSKPIQGSMPPGAMPTQQPMQQPPSATHLQMNASSGTRAPQNAPSLPTTTQVGGPVPVQGQIPTYGQQLPQGPYPPQWQQFPQGQPVSQGQYAQAVQQNPHGQFVQPGQGPGSIAPMPAKNLPLPQGLPAPQAATTASGAGSATQPPANSTHKRTWSKSKADYSGGEWGDNW